VTFVDIPAMHADFCMKFCTTIKQENIAYTLLPSFIEISLKMTKLCRFNRDKSPIYRVPFRVLFHR